MEPLRILLVDDHILFRKGIRMLLESRIDFQVLAEADDGARAVREARRLKPDVVLMDVNMPRLSGLDAMRQIVQELPQTQVVMLTVSDDEDDLFAAIKHGARGYLLKSLSPEQLFEMLEGLREGHAAITGGIAAKILTEFQQLKQAQDQQDEPANSLTEREVEVLEELVRGATNREIGARLHITENTVKIHLRSILEKLQVQNRIQAAVHAVQTGLVDYAPTDLDDDDE